MMKSVSSICSSGCPWPGGGCVVAPAVGPMCAGGFPFGGGGVPSPVVASVAAVFACSGIGGGGYLCLFLDGGVVVVLSCVVWKSGCVGVTLASFRSFGLGGGGALKSRPGVLDPGGVFSFMGVGHATGGAFGVVGHQCRIPCWLYFRL